jgi:hypothetical protein
MNTLHRYKAINMINNIYRMKIKKTDYSPILATSFLMLLGSLNFYITGFNLKE